MKYTVEGDIDFYKEIAEKEEDTSRDETTCLISYQPLTKNSIKLICGHQFNYLPLYTEVCNQKKKINGISLETTLLKLNQMKCPYCRIKIDTILPFIAIYDENGNKLINRVYGVNVPERFCMKNIACEWIYKQGKQAGEPCQKNANYIKNDNVEQAYCNTHWQKINKVNNTMEKKHGKAKTKENNIKKNSQNENKNSILTNESTSSTETNSWTTEMNEYSKEKSLIEIKQLLREKGEKVTGNKKELIQRIFDKNIV
jgi:hypothetical protein